MNTDNRQFIHHLVTVGTVVAATTMICPRSISEEGIDAFPAELVKFSPASSNPVFEGSGKGHWDEHIRERGWILRDGDSWKMWYTGFEGGGGNDGPNLKLGYATSTDGLQWTRHPDNPIYDEMWVEDMMVIKHKDVFYMFAEGKGDIAQLLTSTDGLHWTNLGPMDIRLTNGEPISDGPRGTPAAWIEGGTWYLFYERRDLGIWLATSNDTKVWTNVSDDPVIKLGPEKYDDRQVACNQIVKYQGRYYANYHGSGHENPHLWSTNVATSEDLIHWTKYSGNPLFPTKDNKSSGILVHDGTQYRFYTMHDRVIVHFPAVETSP
ncbi:MAG: glycosylase [Verrucomicrobiae bacterium]|nr:glycosylase [Verrucomicrobiae bacterium]